MKGGLGKATEVLITVGGFAVLVIGALRKKTGAVDTAGLDFIKKYKELLSEGAEDREVRIMREQMEKFEGIKREFAATMESAKGQVKSFSNELEQLKSGLKSGDLSTEEFKSSVNRLGKSAKSAAESYEKIGTQIKEAIHDGDFTHKT